MTTQETMTTFDFDEEQIFTWLFKFINDNKSLFFQKYTFYSSTIEQDDIIQNVLIHLYKQKTLARSMYEKYCMNDIIGTKESLNILKKIIARQVFEAISGDKYIDHNELAKQLKVIKTCEENGIPKEPENAYMVAMLIGDIKNYSIGSIRRILLTKKNEEKLNTYNDEIRLAKEYNW